MTILMSNRIRISVKLFCKGVIVLNKIKTIFAAVLCSIAVMSVFSGCSGHDDDIDVYPEIKINNDGIKVDIDDKEENVKVKIDENGIKVNVDNEKDDVNVNIGIDGIKVDVDDGEYNEKFEIDTKESIKPKGN